VRSEDPVTSLVIALALATHQLIRLTYTATAVCRAYPTRRTVVATSPRMTCSPFGSCSLRLLQVGQALHLSGTPESFAAQRFCPAALAHQSKFEQLSRRQHRSQILRRKCHTNLRCSFKSRNLLVHRPALPVTLLVCWLRQICYLCQFQQHLCNKVYFCMQSIALTEESPAWTLDQIAGLVFGVGRLDR